MIYLCCGDREWKNWDVIWQTLRHFPSGTEIVHGACRGADLMCDHAARAMGFRVHPYPADWKRYGRAAGPIRNQLMLNSHTIDHVCAFHDHIEDSTGTADMIRRAKKAGITFTIITSPDHRTPLGL